MKNNNFIIFFNDEQAYEAGNEYGQDLADYLCEHYDGIDKKHSEGFPLSRFRDGLFDGFLRRYFQNNEAAKNKITEHDLNDFEKKEITNNKNEKTMNIKKNIDNRKLLSPNSTFLDYVKVYEDIHTNSDNPYIMFPNHVIAHNLGYDLGRAGCEYDYRDRIEGDIENNTDSQEYIIMRFKQGFKQGVINYKK